MEEKLSMENIDSMGREEFVKYFCHVIEHGREYAERVCLLRPFRTSDALLKAFDSTLDNASLEDKELILKNYPELGTKGKMTRYSVNEHESAGLNKMRQKEDEELETLNKRYTDKFGFPFVVCVKDKNPEIILSLLKNRIDNDKMTEIQIGIGEVKKIAKVRILPIIKI